MSGIVADHVVVGRRIRAARGAERPGFVALAGDRIIVVDTADGSPDDLIGPRTTVTDARDGTVLPGLHDNHTFFTSQLLDHGGLDARPLTDADAVAAAGSARDAGRAPVLRVGEAERAERLVAMAEAAHPGVDLVVVAEGRAAIAGTAEARRSLGDLDPDSNESLAGLYARLAADPAAVRDAMAAAAAVMHRGGVTSVKDIAFDTHLGMLPTLDGMLADGSLRLRYAFASQPVARPADLDAGRSWRARQRADAKGAGAGAVRPAARFHGFKLMTDGSFDTLTADLLPPDDAWRARQSSEVDYGAVQAEAERILAAGFRLALNADGDGAVRACLHVFERFAGDLPDGCSLSDVSLIDDGDAARLGRLGLAVETYPQMLRYPGYTVELMEELLGAVRGRRLANLPALLASGAVLTAGTDFPLFRPSLPESLLSSAERVLGVDDVDRVWLPANAVARGAVIDAWTAGAAEAMGAPGEWGVLRPGAAADLVVYDADLLSADRDELAHAGPTLVIAGGETVHGG